MRFPGEVEHKTLVRLLSDGQRDAGFYNSGLGGGKLTPWSSDAFYVATSQTVRRILSDGTQDPSFIGMNLGLYFSSLQGGDYHVYPDGRILMSGMHQLHDSIRGYEGSYCLCWFSNTGYLDTAAHHRTCAGSLDYFRELPDGQFIGSLGNPPNTASWEGTPTSSNVIRFNADGDWDPGFQANVWWGTAYGFLPLADGRVYVGGNFMVTGVPDTLNLVRLLPDGSLDPAFNNTARYRDTDPNNPSIPPKGIVRTIHQLSPDRLVVTGGFGEVDGEPRGGIALIDTSGNLLSDQFAGGGGGGYNYQATPFSTPYYYRVVSGIVPAEDGRYYIWGAYHGYDDGTTNDTLQRMVSRLYGANVGMSDAKEPPARLDVFPNPAEDRITVRVPPSRGNGRILLGDAQGRVLEDVRTSGNGTILPVGHLAAGLYTLEFRSDTGDHISTKWIRP